MKILVIVFHFPPISGGGVVVISDIVNSFAKLGHEITVITPDLEWNGPKYEPKIDQKIKTIRVKVPSRSNLKVAARRCKSNLQKKGEEICKSTNIDFIFTIFHPFHLAPSAAVSCAKKFEIPVIVKVDDAVYEKSSGLKSIQRKFEKIINSKTLRNASKVLVMNENTKQTIQNFYNVNQEKISIIPNGIDLSFFNLKKLRNEKKVVFSGAMYHHRGLDILLRAASKIVEKIPNTKFILLGDGPEVEKLKKIVVTNKLSSNVEFRGWINRKQIPQELSYASVGIGPLKLTTVTKNALPIKVLEYMASSLPIVALNGTLPDDVLFEGKNGFFVENEDKLVEKLVLLLKDPNLIEKMGSESRKMVQKFSWENISNSILDIGKSLKEK